MLCIQIRHRFNYYNYFYFEMEGKIFSDQKRALFFVYEELFILFLLVIQLYKIFGMQLTEQGLQVFAIPVLPQNWLWFIATILVLGIIYFGIAKKR